MKPSRILLIPILCLSVVVADATIINKVIIGQDDPSINFPYEYETVGVLPGANLRLQSPNGILIHSGPDLLPVVHIRGNGFVGIGGQSPTTPFDVVTNPDSRIQFSATKGTLVAGNNNGGSIYFGADVTTGNNMPTAAIESSWGGAHTPQIAMGVIREQNRRSAVLFDFSGNSIFYSYNTERMRLNRDGKLGIGTTSPTHALTVNGPIRAKEVIVDTGWADDVFASDYRLASLKEVEAHIEQEGRLPGMPSAKEVAENGLSVGEAQSLLLRKIEELTLHVIRLEKKNEQLEQRLAEITEPKQLK